MFNALQPGVFALSGWDLAGMLTIDPELGQRPDSRRRHALDQPRLARSYRHRGVSAHPWGRLPAGRSLYGTLPDQLQDPESFASQLSRIIEVRRQL